MSILDYYDFTRILKIVSCWNYYSKVTARSKLHADIYVFYAHHNPTSSQKAYNIACMQVEYFRHSSIPCVRSVCEEDFTNSLLT